MKREIGSEFQMMQFESSCSLSLPRSGSLVFSGRTAIEAVLKKLSSANTVLLPSYCCDSMIEPFKVSGMNIKYYDVNWYDGLKIEIIGNADILLWCNYFGFRNDMPEFDGIIIEDITHSFLSKNQFHERSDYLVASLRKWEPLICGGYCSVRFDGDIPPQEFVDLKKEAMKLKAEYLEDNDAEKKAIFLRLFDESNRWLADHYSGLSIDSWSKEYLRHVDMVKQRAIRRRNAHLLYEGLKSKVRFLFPENALDCPLFVPVLVENRDRIRQHLIGNGIYCPVHWPRPKECRSNIYDRELSLICDQRYGTEDMERIVSVLAEAL